MFKTNTVKLKCLYCGKAPATSQEVLEINYFGFHLGCDHVYSDVIKQETPSEN